MRGTIVKLCTGGWSACVVAGAVSFFGVAAAAEYQPMRYADWQRAHPNAEAQIADLKAKTASLVAPALARFLATQPAPRLPYPELTARSAALSAAERAATMIQMARGLADGEVREVARWCSFRTATGPGRMRRS